MRKGPRGRRDRRPREQHRINHRIRVPEVRLIREDGSQAGVIPTDEARQLAKEAGLDLVEIAARSKPPVCRIMDYGRFKYEESKKQKAAKKHASSMELKEIKFRPKTDRHDLEFKIKHVRRFLEEGNKCRLVVIFRGREVTHPKTGLAVYDKVMDVVEDIGQIEVKPNLEGKRMVMIVGPKAGVVKRAKQVRSDKAKAESRGDRPDEGDSAESKEPAAESKEPAASAPAAAKAES
ncbi:MAG: translation initiation factor IF-3 [Deltaproteobacteria bacterium]|nr:translation initiation factor IF-3 [Deltaproteobacteria bacterium]